MKKPYFKEKTAAQILKNPKVAYARSDLVNEVLGLDPNTALVIETDLVPKRYETSKKFMKHAPEVKVHRAYSIDDVISSAELPVDLRREAFNNISNRAYPGYSIRPYWGNDTRIRRISLTECLEGARIYWYANQEWSEDNIRVVPYDNARRVSKDGAEIIVSVPSRMEGHDDFEFKLSSVPVVDSPRKFAVAYNIATTHNCRKKLFDIRYRFKEDKESSRVFSFCAHEVAAYLAIIDHYIKEGNLVPLEMSQFAIPTEFTVGYDSKLRDQVLVHTSSDEKPRRLLRGEREILLWGLINVMQQRFLRTESPLTGHDATFFASGKKVREYDWR